MLADVQKETKNLALSPATKKLHLECAKSTFEAIVIFSQLAPSQCFALMRLSLDSLAHELSSTETHLFLAKNASKKDFPNASRFITSVTALALTRPKKAAALQSEISQWAHMAEEKRAIGEA